jgi:para-nitrobenzyl esterase
MIICPSFATADRLAEKSPVSMYEFADRTAPAFKSLGFPLPAVPGFEPGAEHTTELQYLFAYQAAAHPLSNDQNRLADEMVKQWVAFGRPAAAQVWKRYDPRNRETTFLDLSDSAGLHAVSDAFERHHCGFWAGHPTVPASLLP